MIGMIKDDTGMIEHNSGMINDSTGMIEDDTGMINQDTGLISEIQDTDNTEIKRKKRSRERGRDTKPRNYPLHTMKNLPQFRNKSHEEVRQYILEKKGIDIGSNFNFLFDNVGSKFVAMKNGNNGYVMHYISKDAILQDIGYVEEPPTVVLNVEPINDGSILLRMNTDFFYPGFMHREAEYIVYVDGAETEFLPHNFQDIEIFFTEDNQEIRIGAPHKGIDTTTVLFESARIKNNDTHETLPFDNPSLKLQLDYEINLNDVKCPNPEHVLSIRPDSNTKYHDSTIVCVKQSTADKLGWYVYEKQ